MKSSTSQRASFARSAFLLSAIAALAAAPAEYQVTGVKTLIVSHTGIVYEKDLVPDTLATFQKMELFDPDSSWQPTEDQW